MSARRASWLLSARLPGEVSDSFGNDAVLSRFFPRLLMKRLQVNDKSFEKFPPPPTTAHCTLPQRNGIDGLVSGPGCSSVLWLISGDPDRYPGSASDQSSSICGQQPAEVLANQSSSGSAMTSRVLFLRSVFTGNQALAK